MKFRHSILAAGVAAALLSLPAAAQFTERTIRLSNGVNQEHPVGNGVAKMNACVGEKSGGKMKIQCVLGRRARRRPAGDAVAALGHAGDGGDVDRRR